MNYFIYVSLTIFLHHKVMIDFADYLNKDINEVLEDSPHDIYEKNKSNVQKHFLFYDNENYISCKIQYVLITTDINLKIKQVKIVFNDILNKSNYKLLKEKFGFPDHIQASGKKSNLSKTSLSATGKNFIKMTEINDLDNDSIYLINWFTKGYNLSVLNKHEQLKSEIVFSVN